MPRLIYKLLFFLVVLTFNFTLFSCSVHYKKESIMNNKQKYSYLLSLNNLIAPNYILNRLNSEMQYDLLFVVSLPPNNTDSELTKYNNYINTLLQHLKQHHIKYKYKEIAAIKEGLHHYEFDVYYRAIQNKAK
ncbi:hypothetical protein HAV_01094 [Candidatus Hepatincola sp. Av]